MTEDLRAKVEGLLEELDTRNAQDIIAIDVADKTIVAEWFIICSGLSVPQVKALCEHVDEKAPELGLELRRKEGYTEGRWIVMDYSSILVHIFHPDERRYYNMERLWADADNCIRK